MTKERSNNLKTTINVISSVGVLIINLCVSFFLSPYIIRTVGIEANGFVTLANNFVMYADLIVTALNAMAARFIAISYVQKDYKKANLYYNSVFWGNLIIVVVLLIPATFLIVFLENVINIPQEIVIDVKILFSLVFLGFFLRTGAPNYDCGTYVTNRMDLTYIPNMITACFRCVFLVCMFSIIAPHVWIVSLASLLVIIITLAIAGYNTHKLTPELKIELKAPICSFIAVKELVGSGVWSSIGSAGYMLLNGLDLLVCNAYVGATAMGILALSKTLGNIVGQLADSVRAAFGPELTISYAKGDMKDIYRSLMKAIKILSIMISIPAAGVVVMGDAFFALWVPTQNAILLSRLTTLSILSLLFNGGVSILLNVFSTVNRVKENSIIMLLCGFISFGITVLIIIFTDYDIYAVAGVSSIVTIFKNWIYVIPKSSKLLGFKWYQFFPAVFLSALASSVIIVIGFFVRSFLPTSSWITFLFTSSVIAVLGLITNMYIILNKEERKYLINIFCRKVRR